MTNHYRVLSQQVFTNGNYKIIPIRFEDRFKIMQWRNEQIYHLRQKKIITKMEQDEYFKKIISKSFNQEAPDQILFSFLKNGVFIGYGGLVHINWIIKEAEISFLFETKKEEKYFSVFWSHFLDLIEKVAFKNLELLRIFTYSYNLRPKLYKLLEKKRYLEETRGKIKLLEHEDLEAIYNAKYSQNFSVRKAKITDIKLIYEWNNDITTRKNSISESQFDFHEHKKWFLKSIKNDDLDFFVVLENGPVGSFRVEKKENFLISFLVAPEYRGMKIGSKIISYVINNYVEKNINAYVLESNLFSQKIFKKYDFKIVSKFSKNNKQIIKFQKNQKNEFI